MILAQFPPSPTLVFRQTSRFFSYQSFITQFSSGTQGFLRFKIGLILPSYIDLMVNTDSIEEAAKKQCPILAFAFVINGFFIFSLLSTPLSYPIMSSAFKFIKSSYLLPNMYLRHSASARSPETDEPAWVLTASI